MLIYPLAFLVTLGVLVTIHEYGHFLVARWSGVRVLRFSIGFGKPIWSRLDRHGTEFVLAAIPLGGYVRMLDKRDDAATTETGLLGREQSDVRMLDKPDDAAASVDMHNRRGGSVRTMDKRDVSANIDIQPDDVFYNQLSVWWRMAIALAGPAANFLLAIVAYWWLAVAGSANLVPMVGKLDPQSAVARAGMEDFQEIVSVDDRAVRSWQEIVMALSDRLGDTGVVEIGVRGFGENTATAVGVPLAAWLRGAADPDLLQDLGLIPAHPPVVGVVQADGPASRGGVRPWDRIAAIDGAPMDDWNAMVDAIQAAPDQSMQWTVVRQGLPLELSVTPRSRPLDDGSTAGFVGIGLATNQVRHGPLEAIPRGLSEALDKTLLTLGHLKKMLFGDVSVRNLGGPITIAKVAGDSAQAGWRVYVGILALLSISLGVLNLLPIPILDGGHVLYCLAELIGRRPVPDRVQMVGAQVGLAMVGGLIVLVFINDIARLL